MNYWIAGGDLHERAARSEATNAGFAAVDALVALAILSSTIVVGLAALHSGRQLAATALEAHRATELLQDVLSRKLDTPGLTVARSGDMVWRLTVGEPDVISAASALCRADAEVVADKTGRHYKMSTARICEQ